MQCRCPLCGCLTQVPAELINYLTRCDACSGLLRPQMATRDDGKDILRAEPVGLGRVREQTSQGSGIAELLSPPLVKKITRRTPPSPASPPPMFAALTEAAAKEVRTLSTRQSPIITDGIPLVPPAFPIAAPPPLPPALPDSISPLAAQNVSLGTFPSLKPAPSSRKVALSIASIVLIACGLIALGAMIALKIAGSGPRTSNADPAPIETPPPALQKSSSEKPRRHLAQWLSPPSAKASPAPTLLTPPSSDDTLPPLLRQPASRNEPAPPPPTNTPVGELF